jgi:hypothetical protein
MIICGSLDIATKLRRRRMINFCDEWECDGCGGMFDKTELVDSIQLPYYSCVDCEEELKQEMEKDRDY